MPKSLPGFIESEFAPFKHLSANDQRRISVMLWLWASGRFSHVRYPSTAAFTGSLLTNIWGNLAHQRKTCRGYFGVIQGDNISKVASGYSPMDFLGRALIRYLQSPEPDTLVDLSGKEFAAPRNVILTRAANKDPLVENAKRSVWVGIQCARFIKINQQALEKFIQSTDDRSHQLSALLLLKLSHNAKFPGCIPVQYEQKSTGRLVETLSAIQSTPREVLSAALTGYWDYDLSNAHFAILSALAKKYGLISPVIDEYLTQKRRIRNELAEYCAADIDDIKSGLISLLYGAALNPHEKYASLGKSLGSRKAKRFVKHPFVKSLNNEIKTIGGHIVSGMRKHAGHFINVMNIGAKPTGKRNQSAVLLSHALQGYEALALKTVMRHFGDHIVLPMHDGWISDQRLECEHLSRLIFEATGLSLEIEENRLPKYPPRQSPEFKPKRQLQYNVDELISQFDHLFSKSHGEAVSGLWVSASPQWAAYPGVSGRLGRKRVAQK
ncbi:MAG: hypothetical protein RLZZ192_764 [Pseudomonadota bacterium]|jgi:hypothetical protein